MPEIDREKNTILSSIFVLIFCFYFLIETMEYSSDAALFPRIILVTMVICSLILLIKSSVILLKASTKDSGSSLVQKIKQQKLPLIFYVFLLIYIYILPRIGFEISVVIFMVGGMYLIDKQQLKKYPYVPVLLPAIFFVVFRVLLNVNLPTAGILFF